MIDMGYYMLDGHDPVWVGDVIVWGKWHASANRIVAKTDIGDVRVSTVFLGLDHQFAPDGPPLLFETMVFGGSLNGEQERYSTWDEAELGHEAMCERVRGGAEHGL